MLSHGRPTQRLYEVIHDVDAACSNRYWRPDHCPGPGRRGVSLNFVAAAGEQRSRYPEGICTSSWSVSSSCSAHDRQSVGNCARNAKERPSARSARPLWPAPAQPSQQAPRTVSSGQIHCPPYEVYISLEAWPPPSATSSPWSYLACSRPRTTPARFSGAARESWTAVKRASRRAPPRPPGHTDPR